MKKTGSNIDFEVFFCKCDNLTDKYLALSCLKLKNRYCSNSKYLNAVWKSFLNFTNIPKIRIYDFLPSITVILLLKTLQILWITELV